MKISVRCGFSVLLVAAAAAALGAQTPTPAPAFPKVTYLAHPPDDPAATVTVTFDDKGYVTGKVDGEMIVQGKYVVTGTKLEFLDQTGPMACALGQHGAYTWKIDGDRISFTLVKDECDARVNALTTFTWTLSKKLTYGAAGLLPRGRF